MVHGEQQAADEPHVVVQRQPGDAALPERALLGDVGVDRGKIREHVRVSERDRLGLHRGSGRELDERQVLGRGGHLQLAARGKIGHRAHAQLGASARGGLAEQPADSRVGE